MNNKDIPNSTLPLSVVVTADKGYGSEDSHALVREKKTPCI